MSLLAFSREEFGKLMQAEWGHFESVNDFKVDGYIG
jgi:hypothetical protein